MKDLYCFLCSLQFESRSIYDLHLSLIHNYKCREEIFVKKELEEEVLPICSKNIQSKPKENQGLVENILSVQEKKKPFKCKFCGNGYSYKSKMNRHVSSVHEGKKPFKCEFCNYGFSTKGDLNKHVASVHERKKPFKCEYCSYTCSRKSSLNIHVTSVH